VFAEPMDNEDDHSDFERFHFRRDRDTDGIQMIAAISWEIAAYSLANGSRSDTPRNGLHRLGGLW